VAGFAPKPNFSQWSHRSPPCSFFGRCDCETAIQNAIDFAEAALSATPAYHPAAHHATFSAGAICEAAIDFAVLPILARRGRLCT